MAQATLPRLVTTRYTVPGVYIGQLIRPGVGNLNADARICNYIGRGSRLAVGTNLGIRRSFVYGEELVVSTSIPYEAQLFYPCDGVKDAPTRLYDSVTGVELRPDQWQFIKIGSEFRKIQIAPSAYNPLAVYYVDYQSTSRETLDPLPIANLRTIKSLGTVQNKAEFEDMIDFFLPYSFSGPTPGSDNLPQDTLGMVDDIMPDAGNNVLSTGSFDASGSSYTHKYNRFYTLEVKSVGATVEVYWSSTPYSGGKDSLPANPLYNGAGVSEQRETFTFDPIAPAPIDLSDDLGVRILPSTASVWTAGDIFYFNGIGPGLMEWDGRYTNLNQFLEVEVDTTAMGGTLSLASDSTYTGVYNTKFKIKVVSVTGTGIVGDPWVVKYIWGQYGDVLGTSSVNTETQSFTADNTFILSQGVKVKVEWGLFTVGDTFTVYVKAPKIYYDSKDDRTYTFTVSQNPDFPEVDQAHIVLGYSTGTSSGGFGSKEITAELPTFPTTEFFKMSDNIRLAVRNLVCGDSREYAPYSAGDTFVASCSCENQIDWSLTKKVEEIRETSSFLVDITGSVTGTAGSKYIILDSQYYSGSVSVVDYNDNSIAYSIAEVPNSRFIVLISTITDTVLVKYEYRGKEPSPGQLYYLTAFYLRPTNLYNDPMQVLDRTEGRLLLGPSEMENHLYIMNELVFDCGAPGAYYTQIYDADGDGVIQRTDVSESLSAHEKVSRITDLCVLSQFESLSDALTINEKANDPFEKREQMLWVGAPIGTPIGDIDTEDSLVFLARSTLQVPTQSVAQGTRVLVSPTRATKTIKLENGINQTVILDGSFVAGATAALVGSFTDPSTDILRRNLPGFDSIQTYSDPENLILGNASITWLTNQGSGVFRFEEDVTVHTLSEEFQLISATTQKQYVTKVVRRELDNNVISVVVPSAQSGISIIRSTLAEILLGMLGRGLIADYQDVDGNVREFDPTKDIVVMRDTSTLTKYDLFYCYWIKAPIKRIFGLYTVNTNDFGF